MGDALGSMMRIGRPTLETFCRDRIDPQSAANRGQEVTDNDGPLDHRHTIGGRFADRVSTVDAASHEDGRPGQRKMIAAVVGIDLRRTAKFAHPDDQRAVEHAPILEIVDEVATSPRRAFR